MAEGLGCWPSRAPLWVGQAASAQRGSGDRGRVPVGAGLGRVMRKSSTRAAEVPLSLMKDLAPLRYASLAGLAATAYVFFMLESDSFSANWTVSGPVMNNLTPLRSSENQDAHVDSCDLASLAEESTSSRLLGSITARLQPVHWPWLSEALALFSSAFMAGLCGTIDTRGFLQMRDQNGRLLSGFPFNSSQEGLPRRDRPILAMSRSKDLRRRLTTMRPSSTPSCRLENRSGITMAAFCDSEDRSVPRFGLLVSLAFGLALLVFMARATE